MTTTAERTLTLEQNKEVERQQTQVENWLASKRPGEYLRTDKNRQLLTDYLEEHGLDVTANNLETAHYALLSANPCLLDEDPAGGLHFPRVGQRDPSKWDDRIIRKDPRNMTAREFAAAISESRSFRHKMDARP